MQEFYIPNDYKNIKKASITFSEEVTASKIIVNSAGSTDFVNIHPKVLTPNMEVLDILVTDNKENVRALVSTPLGAKNVTINKDNTVNHMVGFPSVIVSGIKGVFRSMDIIDKYVKTRESEQDDPHAYCVSEEVFIIEYNTIS